MPTECERSVTSPSSTAATTILTSSSTLLAATSNSVSSATEIKDNLTNFNEDIQMNNMMEGDMSTSQTSTTSNGSSCNGGRKTSITSPDPTAYVAKARVTRPTPPPPPYNPMQFVQIKPCNLYQTAQEQLKKAEEVKKIKEIRKEEPEDWQNNLDNWKSSRRKRVEHIIDRVVEVKKLELEEHDRTRRKSKTFSEMIEERSERPGNRPGLNKLVSLAVYAEDEANDLSDLGIGTSSASGKSSLSEDYDNNSVMSDNAAELDKAITNSNHKPTQESTTREYISSPGYETSSSTAPASSPDPCEYTYEGAIQDYKQRVSRAASGLTSVALNKLSNPQNSKESTPERGVKETTSAYPPRRGSKIEDRLMGFEVQSPSSEECVEKNKVDVPKVDISKRKEMFENQQQQQSQQSANEPKSQLTGNGGALTTGAPRVTLRDRFKVQESTETISEQPKKDIKRMSGDITSIKERLQNLEQQQNLVNGANGATKTTANKLVDVTVPPLKERLSSLQNAVTKEEVRKPPVVLIDARQLEIMKSEDQKVKQTMKENALIEQQQKEETNCKEMTTKPEDIQSEETEVDRDDSGIHTADDIELEERLQADLMKKEQEIKLNAAIEALALEEKQLSAAANAVNQIEAEFEELTLGSVALPPLASSNSSATTITNDHMEYSVSSTNNTCLTPPSTSIPSSDSNSNSSLKLNNNNEVKGIEIKTTSNLRRKPTNEMVHAKNLLKIFKETFQNDIELDEDEIKEEHETKDIREVCKETTNTDAKPLSLNINTQVFQNSNATEIESSASNLDEQRNSSETSKTPTQSINSPLLPPFKAPLAPLDPSFTSLPNAQTSSIHTHSETLPQSLETPMTPSAIPLSNAQVSSTHNVSETLPQTPQSPSTPSGIPRCMTPSGKPPMSPLTIRSTTKFVAVTPPGSPSLTRKNDSQFSINGRVEIFNSKTMTTTPCNNSSLPKPTTPTMTTKKTQLPYINATTSAATIAATPTTSSQSNNIVLPQQYQQQQTKQAATTKQQQQQQETTVIEPLSTITTSEIAVTTQTKQMKSMPSQQMVNEPQIMLDGETYHQQPNHTNDAVKHQQQQQQQTEVVICAPPITIVNPDELPKPNTVKNLSSCFQQQDETVYTKKIIPKPLPRSRIPQATPPQSPTAAKRHVCYSSEQSSSANSPDEQKKLNLDNTSSNSLGSQQQKKLSPSVLEEQKKLSPSALEEQKKLSIISTSSNSSTSTASTVIEANKKLSIMSNISSTSSEAVSPTIVKTNSQVHKDFVKDETSTPSDTLKNVTPERQPTPARTLDKEATQALIDEMMKADALSRALPVNNKNNLPNQVSSPTSPNVPSSPVSPRANFLKFGEVRPYQGNRSTTPLSPKLNERKQIPGSTSTPLQPFNEFNKNQDSSCIQNLPASPSSPKANFLKFGEIRPYQGSSPASPKLSERKQKPNTPTSPLQSPKSELFRTTKPLVVSTLYDKYLPESLPPNNQRTPLVSPKSKEAFSPNNQRTSLPSPKPKEVATTPTIVIPADLPPLIECPPNDSSLYKLASSAPHSPSSPCSNPDKILDIDAALCNSLLTSLAVTPDVLQRQVTIEEDLFEKIDKEDLPFNKPITGFAEISKTDIKRCDGLNPSTAHKLSTQRQKTVEEELCQKLDITTLPDGKQQPITGFKCISPTEIRKCDNFFGTNSGKPNSKPNSPIMQARAAHSKALIETCEKIIAEEKQASSQMKSTLPSSPKGTPVLQRKSKIPKPITSCCKATESLNEADLKEGAPEAINTSSNPTTTTSTPTTPSKEDNNGVIARMHVVETQIKVTTTTPPASPKVANKPQPSPKPTKKTKNIFEFLKKNFGVGGSSQTEEASTKESELPVAEKPELATPSSPSENKVLVLSVKDLEDLGEVKYDEIHKFDKSKFYLASQDTEEAIPPPLPKTPAPVNIEITRKIITDEILEDGKSEMDLTKEIDDLLDDELNKLNHEVEELDKLGKQ